jgi:hypothetical protein
MDIKYSVIFIPTSLKPINETRVNAMTLISDDRTYSFSIAEYGHTIHMAAFSSMDAS